MSDSDNRETTSAPQERAIVHQSTWLTMKSFLSVGAISSTLVMVVYFWRIRYVPIEGLADIAAVGGIALMGCLLIVGVLLVLWGAPLLLQWGIWEQEDVCWFVDAGAEASGEKQRTDRNKVVRFAANSIGLGWLGFCVIAFFPAINGILSALIIAALCAVSMWYLRDFVCAEKKSRFAYGRRIFLVLMNAVMALLPLYAVVWIFGLSNIGIVHASWLAAIFVTLLAGFVAVCVNAMGFTQMLDERGTRSAWLQPLGLNAAMLAAVLVVSGAIMPFLDVAMTLSTIRLPNATLVLRENACKDLQAMGIEVAKTGSSTDLCLLTEVNVLSRLGQRWWIDCGRATIPASAPVKHGGFTVLAAEVSSWRQSPARGGAGTVASMPHNVCGSISPSEPPSPPPT